jgi:predicted kinase
VTLIALAGLPGTGKSTLACALAAELGAPVFDKDAVRAGLFGPQGIEYSRAQDDLCVERTYRAAEDALRGGGEGGGGRPAHALLDGRTYSRAGQVEALRAFAARAELPLLLVECVCSVASAVERLARDAAAGRHPAADRGPELHRRLRREAVPIDGAKLVIDTDRLPLPEQVAAVRAALRTPIADPD